MIEERAHKRTNQHSLSSSNVVPAATESADGQWSQLGKSDVEIVTLL